ncbi:MAG TPA: hypothetical protein VJ806_15800 [Luteimonas sp.]|nr:hypothetical protein [Luteimonas sp.]
MVAKKQPRNVKETTLRHVWLAALGAAVVARREVRTAGEIAVEEAGKLRARTVRFAADAAAVARGGVLTVAERIEPKLQSVGGEIESRLAPVLEKLGLAPKTRRPVRKARRPAAKSRRAARPATKRARGVRR